MHAIRVWSCLILFALSCVVRVLGQQSTTATSIAAVPSLVNYSGSLNDSNGKALSGTVGVTFALYRDEEGGSPLWLETQNVHADARGRYSVMLGSTTSTGLPAELFVAGEARWLGVQVQGQSEQPRVMLLSVPYALKAGDAATVGGLPPSAFVLAGPASSNPPSSSGNENTGSAPAASVVSGSGTTNFVPLWFSPSILSNSVLFQLGSGNTATMGINTTTPAATLDVNGSVIARGALQLPTTGTATSGGGFNSQPFSLQGSAFNSGTGKAIGPMFQWQTEPSGNNTSNPAGSLNLLYGNGSGSPGETGLNIASNGQVTFVPTQTFPGTGTVTSVGSGAGLTGGPITGTGTLSIATGGVSNAMLANPFLTVAAGTDLTGGGSVALGGTTTLNLDTTKVPQLGAANIFTGNQTVNGSLSVTGQLISTISSGTAPLQVTSTTQVPNLNASFLDGFSASAFQVAGSYATLGANTFGATQTVGTGDLSLTNGNIDLPETASATGGVITIGGYPFLHGCCTRFYNTFVGSNAGNFTMTGTANTAVGEVALAADTSGYSNSAFGAETLSSNTTGTYNTAAGLGALYTNTTGNSNTADGFDALQNNTTGSQNVAIGYYAGFNPNSPTTAGSNNTFVGYSANPGTQTALNNATAIGSSSLVTANGATAIGANSEADGSNALVLGSIAGINNATASTNVGIGTTTPAFSLDVHGTGNFTGLVNFSKGQTFPGTGTVTSVGSGAGLTGGPITGSGSLSIASSSCPAGSAFTSVPSFTCSAFATLAANTFAGNQTVNGNVSATGGFSIGSNLFDYGSYASANAFLGFAGSSATGTNNTGSGYGALASNTGMSNTAVGVNALNSNSNGSFGTAVGQGSLAHNTTGFDNTAVGQTALNNNTTGSENTAVGVASGITLDNSSITGASNTFLGNIAAISTGTLTNATAVGSFAAVSESNALVLGSIAGVNNCTPQNNCASTNVGIGTTSPDNLLSVNGNADKPGGGSWGTFSDRRLKTVDGGFTSGLSQVLKINPVRYRYRQDNAMGIRDADAHVGLVAQEVQRVIPEAVTENSKGYLLVNNDPIIWAMLNAIKEQQSEIASLRKQVTLLSTKVRQPSARTARRTGKSIHEHATRGQFEVAQAKF